MVFVILISLIVCFEKMMEGIVLVDSNGNCIL
jgi:hypothetical protein